MIKPLHDMVVIKPIETSNVNASGLYVGNSKKDKQEPKQGEIIAVGPGKYEQDGNIKPMVVTVGQKVIYHPETATPYEENSIKYDVVSQERIFLIMEEESGS